MSDVDPPYPVPEWFRAAAEAAGGDYTVGDDPVAMGERLARNTDRIATEYFELYLEDPAVAIQGFRQFIDRFATVNAASGVLTPVMPDQFGLLANVASMQYDSLEANLRRELLGKVIGFMAAHHTAKIPFFTAQLRYAHCMRDIVAHSDVFWPRVDEHASFMAHATWRQTAELLANPHDNPLLFALAAPMITTSPDIQAGFETEHSELLEHGLGIIAARLLSAGAWEETRREWHEHRPLGADDSSTWEQSMEVGLLAYSEAYRPAIAANIVDGTYTFADWDLVGQVTKMKQTRFTVSADGHFSKITPP